jgi:hypothetical protein
MEHTVIQIQEKRREQQQPKRHPYGFHQRVHKQAYKTMEQNEHNNGAKKRAHQVQIVP